MRIIRDIQHLHDLGSRPIFEFLAELASDPVTRIDIEANLKRYARLNPGVVAALGGRDLHPPVFAVGAADAAKHRGAA